MGATSGFDDLAAALAAQPAALKFFNGLSNCLQRYHVDNIAGAKADDTRCRRVALDFAAGSHDELWLTDITQHPTGEGKLYLCAIKDVCSNRIVGYSISDRMTAQLG